MKAFLTPILALAACAGCASSARHGGAWIDPMHAVHLAAAAQGRPVAGVFALTVQASDRGEDRIWLNSERDYRDPRNLTIVVLEPAARELGEQLGGDPVARLRGRRIQVTGQARRTRIDFMHDGRATGKYYYQTHVHVTRAAQLRLL
ncbi:hypothetical protein [Lysobacter sp. N42]|uniref:hypothetical protein n=1 Tax=Lysobacter sp. N42 TaxID=2545719 RepID=UPI001042DE50|nr:hypothetical protein [Lysobacter sp. N42]TCZ82037.1 hypothetical protein EYQ95_23480 [Lysobacter sp. N42]